MSRTSEALAEIAAARSAAADYRKQASDETAKAGRLRGPVSTRDQMTAHQNEAARLAGIADQLEAKARRLESEL